MTPKLAEQAKATSVGEPDANEQPTSRSRTARWRSRCAWVCWRAAPVGAAWIVLAMLGVVPGVVAATEGFAAIMIVLVLLFGQLWTVLYVVGKPIENYRSR